jgi:hypothetical protein
MVLPINNIMSMIRTSGSPPACMEMSRFLIAPDGLQPHLLKIIEDHTANLHSSPAAAGLAASKGPFFMKEFIYQNPSQRQQAYSRQAR